MSTSKLQRYTSNLLRTELSQCKIEENRRPDWLITDKGKRLELDLFVDSLGIAIEVQGLQHVQYAPFFHRTVDDFYAQQERDNEKYKICAAAGIDLFYVFDKEDAGLVIEEICDLQSESQLSEKPLPSIGNKKKFAYRESNHLSRSLLNLSTFVIRMMKRQGVEDRLMQQRLQRRIRRIEKHLDKTKIKLRDDHTALINFAHSLIIDQPPKRKKISSKRIRERANKRKVKKFTGSLYLVWGGAGQHVVWLNRDNFLVPYACDCTGWHTARNKICCHVRAVANFLGIVIRRPLPHK